MKKNEILFWVTIIGFFGINGLDLVNGTVNLVNSLYFKIGNLFWVLLVSVTYFISQSLYSLGSIISGFQPFCIFLISDSLWYLLVSIFV